MNSAQPLTTARFLAVEPDDPSLAVATTHSTQPRRGSAWPLAAGVVGVGFAAAIAGTLGIGFLRGGEQPRERSNFGGDLFLWVIGSDLTWKQYQAQQSERGLGRLDENEYDWSQQVLNDAYIGEWEPE